jgi:hypothetical protein
MIGNSLEARPNLVEKRIHEEVSADSQVNFGRRRGNDHGDSFRPEANDSSLIAPADDT